MQAALDHLRATDPVLAAIIDRIGPYALVGRKPDFETMARSIVYQRISGKAAATVFARLRALTGRRFTARALLKVPVEQMRACGLPMSKCSFLIDLAERTVRRQISFTRCLDLSDDELVAHFTQVKGIGAWTVQMFQIFALQHPNILPVADLGVLNAVRRAYGLEAMPTPVELKRIAENWHPYCSIACWYLWRSIDGTAEL